VHRLISGRHTAVGDFAFFKKLTDRLNRQNYYLNSPAP
jgi:hypothetical protein